MRTKLVTSAFSAAVLAVGMLFVGPATSGVAPAEASVQGAHPAPVHRTGSLATASTAIPTTERSKVDDSATGTVHTSSSRKAASVSLATSNCDGCSGVATTFQVAYFDSRVVQADNSAAAWSSCTGCSTSAVSVQLVVARHASQLRVNNRALALNVECTACTTTSAAIQFVITGGTRRELSTQAKDMIAAIQAELGQRLQTVPRSPGLQKSAPLAKSLVDDTASKLANIILKDVGAASVERHIDIKSGQ